MNPYEPAPEELYSAAYDGPVRLVWVREPSGEVHTELVKVGIWGALPWLVQGELPDGRLWWSAAKEFS